jgi:diguanylate cyclase (GGDEF)-like protein
VVCPYRIVYTFTALGEVHKANTTEGANFSSSPVSSKAESADIPAASSEANSILEKNPYPEGSPESISWSPWERIFGAVDQEAEIVQHEATEEARRAAEIALEQVREEIIGIATSKDKLTGLDSLQSAYLMENEIRPRLRQALRAESSPTFLYLDLDGFKAINDTISHDAGDVVLYEFGQAMQDAFRDEDIKLREGGDEFGAILFNADAHNKVDGVNIVRKLSENFNERLRGMSEVATTPSGKEIPFPGVEISNMVAFSAATVEVETDDIRDAKQEADQLLQKAKSSIPKEPPTGMRKIPHAVKQWYREFRNLPPDVEQGKNYLVLGNAPDQRYRIEDNLDLELFSR